MQKGMKEFFFSREKGVKEFEMVCWPFGPIVHILYKNFSQYFQKTNIKKFKKQPAVSPSCPLL